MSDMAAPAPGQFDAQATGVTSASGSASQSLEGELHSLEQQLAELQVDAVTNASFCRFVGRLASVSSIAAGLLHVP